MTIKRTEEQLKYFLLNDVLILILLNNPFSSSFLMNFYFLQPNMSQFDNAIVLSLLVTEMFGFTFILFYLQFRQHYEIFLYSCILSNNSINAFFYILLSNNFFLVPLL